MVKQNSLNSGISKHSTTIGGSHGVIVSLLTYIFWGFAPLYMGFISNVSVIEIIAQRILWSLLITALAVTFFEGLDAVKSIILKNPKVLLKILINAGLLAVYWFLFTYATISQPLETSLGLFISPLISISLGVILLKEPLRPSQIIPLGLIVFAIGIMSTRVGSLPWLALGIAGTRSIYCFYRKTIPASPNSGLLLEMIVLSIPASIVAFGFTKITGQSSFFLKNTHDTMVLIGYSLISGFFACIFSYAIKITRLSYIGIMGYITPTIIFIDTVFFLQKSVCLEEMIAFILVICASVLYAIPAYLNARKKESNGDTLLKKS